MGQERGTQVGADQVLGQGPAEQLNRRGPQPLQVEVQAADPAAADLHRGEVGVAREGKGREIVGGRGPAVQVDEGRGIFAHGRDVRA
ncbi:hypothetical protein [Streptomyces microflavus]|uniref:hypothetical protein n=1 Tax=Streptomyces microflavus TaxID=1919 RepID=UPI0033C893F9